MTHEGNEEDPAMQSMRSVWLSMRDSDAEPPASGLAALMAAARDKADHMKPKEAWWRRSFAMLLRPPVLAAATIVVLIGGAVVLKGRGKDLDSTTTGVASPEEPAPRGELRSSLVKNQDSPPPEVAGQAGGSASVEPTLARPDIKPKPPRDGAGRAPSGNTVSIDSEGQEESPRVQSPPSQGEKSKEKLEEKPVAPEAGGLMIADGDAVDDSVSKPRNAPIKPAAGESLDVTGTSQGRTPRPPSELVDQLVRQTETAAGRKDCAAVRATAQRIKKLDANTYKTRVAKQAAIKSCLK